MTNEDQSKHEDYEERAAILEYDAEMMRKEAEELAHLLVYGTRKESNTGKPKDE